MLSTRSWGLAMTLAEEALVAGSGDLHAEIPFTEHALINKPVQHGRQR